jgi:hypothetical protein
VELPQCVLQAVLRQLVRQEAEVPQFVEHVSNAASIEAWLGVEEGLLEMGHASAFDVEQVVAAILKGRMVSKAAVLKSCIISEEC